MFYLSMSGMVIVLCFYKGCDKPGVPGKKGLSCTSIRNHSSGEDLFLIDAEIKISLSKKYQHLSVLMAENKEQIIPSNTRK